MADVEVRQVTHADAAATMRAAGLRAPVDCHTPEGIAAHGECFELRTGTGSAVFVLRREAGVLWVDGAGARAHGSGLTAAGLALFEQIAIQCGCTQIAFETNRPGLVRAAGRAGYTVAGWTMKRRVGDGPAT